MYIRKPQRLIARRVPTTMGDFWDSIKGAGKGVLDFYGSKSKAEGAAEQANKDLAAALAAQKGGGIDGTTLAIGGAALAGALFLLLRKKS